MPLAVNMHFSIYNWAVCVIQAYLLNCLCDCLCDKGINVSAYLIARGMHDCLSCTRVAAPMTPRITQTTSYQRDALYWRGAEILAPHRQPWTGQAFITTPPVPFPLTDGVICGCLHCASSRLPEATDLHYTAYAFFHKSLIFSQDLDMTHSSVSNGYVLA